MLLALLNNLITCLFLSSYLIRVLLSVLVGTFAWIGFVEAFSAVFLTVDALFLQCCSHCMVSAVIFFCFQ